jgi:hypothetical protein
MKMTRNLKNYVASVLRPVCPKGDLGNLMRHVSIYKEQIMLGTVKPHFKNNIFLAHWDYSLFTSLGEPFDTDSPQYSHEGDDYSIHPNVEAFARFYDSFQKMDYRKLVIPKESLYYLKELFPNTYVDDSRYRYIKKLFAKEEYIDNKLYKPNENGLFMKEGVIFLEYNP